MNRKLGLRALVGAAVSAATLLALAPLGAANAADAPVDMSKVVNKSRITITADPSSIPTTGTPEGHTFAAVRIGQYESAMGDASQNVLSSVAVSTVSDIEADAASALASTKDDLGISPNTAAAGYEDNPVGEVASKWNGSTGTDSTSNTGTVPNGWKGNLRSFVTNLASKSDFQAKFASAPHSATVTSGNTAYIDDLAPGIYVVEDVTASGASGLSSTSHKNSIPMLVGTGINIDNGGGNSTVYNTLNTQALGKVNLKNDAPQVTKALDNTAANDSSVGGTLHYTFSSNVPLTTGYKKYIFTMIDTPSQKGLSYDAVQSIHVGADAPGGTDLTSGQYHVTNMKYSGSDSTQYLVIDLSPSITSLTYGDKILVKFTMKVNDEAKGGSLANGVTLGYSSDSSNQATSVPSVVGDDGTVTNCTTPSSTCTNGTVVNDKTDGSGNDASKSYFRYFDVVKQKKTDGSGLTGAKFTVTKKGESMPIKFLQVGNGSYKKSADQSNNAATDKLAVYDSSATGVAADSAVTANGQLKIDGLADGVYTLAEDTVPAGYSDSFKPSIEVTVGQGSAAGISGFANKADTWGLVAKNGTYNTSGVATGLNDAGFNNLTAVDGTASAIVVKNVNSFSQLPLTGGAGAILALLVVVVLGALTATLIIVRRRLNA